MIVEELVSILGLEIEDDDLPKFQKNVVAATGKVAGLIGAAIAGAASISAMLDVAADTARSSKFARSIDVSFHSLQRLEQAAEKATGSAGSIKGVLQSLERSARGAANGLDGGAAVAFARLGISVHDAAGELKSADRILLDVADSVSRSSNPDLAFTIAEQLGLGPDLNLLLRLGSDGINQLGDEAQRLGLILGDDAAKESERFAEGLARLKRAGQTLLLNVGLPLLEWTNGMVSAFQEWAKSDSGEAVIEGLGEAFLVLRGALRLIAEPFKVVSKLFDEFGPIVLLGLAPAIPLLGSFAAAMWAVASPFVVISAAIAGLLVSLNELRVFFEDENNDSLISRGLKKLGYNPKNVRANLINAFGDGVDGASNLVSGASGFVSRLLDYLPGNGAAGPGGGSRSSSVVVNNDIKVSTNAPEAAARSVVRLTNDNVREAEKTVSSPFVK